jgi:peptidyl-prolyl cis-trans isomerase B (cyclophilin B)
MLKSLRVAVSTALTVAALAACSSSPDEPAPAAAESQSSTASAAAPADGGGAGQITFTTSYGPIVVRTDSRAPKTVAGQSALADDGYFDGTICHRVVTSGIYVLQCGDPTGTGTGDPGYSLPDENLPQMLPNNYPAGTVAMANAGPGTSGSQFFIVYKDSTLPPGYTVWGKVTKGLETVAKIGRENAKAGVTDGQPSTEVRIESATTS